MADSLRDYLDHQVTAADPARLVVMLYERATTDVTQAVELSKEFGDSPLAQDEEEYVMLLLHAQKILNELQKNLDMEQGGEIASNLDKLYEFMQFKLHHCVQTRRDDHLEDILKILTQLTDAWRNVANMGPSVIMPPDAPAVPNMDQTNAVTQEPAVPNADQAPAPGNEYGGQTDAPPATSSGLESILVA